MQLKKPLIAFVTAFAITIGFTSIPTAIYTVFSNVSLSSSNAGFDFMLLETLIISALYLSGLGVCFVVFYFLATRIKIVATKSTTIAVLLGTILGPTIYLGVINAYDLHLVLYLSNFISTAVSSIFYYFLPALTALLFVGIKEKKKLEIKNTD